MSNFAAPRKSLGQNFLQDPNIINKIVSSLNLQRDNIVLEIGPGRGALTELILPQIDNFHLVEFDRDLVAYWQQRESTHFNLRVHGADILKFDLAQLLSGTQGKIKVIGNLPYNISSPVLFHLMNYAESIEAQIFMLQKEVVERMAARPGNKQYGRLSVMLQYRYAIENLFTVPPGAFFPPPKVDSAVARLTPLDEFPIKLESHQDFAKLVKQAFSQRRKTLRNTLKGLLTSEQIEAQSVDPSARAETLEVSDFVRLSNTFSTSELCV